MGVLKEIGETLLLRYIGGEDEDTRTPTPTPTFTYMNCLWNFHDCFCLLGSGITQWSLEYCNCNSNNIYGRRHFVPSPNFTWIVLIYFLFFLSAVYIKVLLGRLMEKKLAENRTDPLMIEKLNLTKFVLTSTWFGLDDWLIGSV